MRSIERRYLPVLTVRAAAAVAKKSPEILQSAIEDGSLPATPFVERVFKVALDDLERWLQERSSAALPENSWTKEPPTFWAITTPGPRSVYLLYCPACRVWHKHEPLDGHRAAACKSGSPFDRSGYFVQGRPGESREAVQAHNESIFAAEGGVL